jgi:ribosome-binding factor A
MLNTARSSARFFLALHPPLNFFKHMENNTSPSNVVKRVDNSIGMILRKVNMREVADREVKLLASLRQNLADARIYSHDYELSETREEQVDNAKRAKKYLEQARGQILKASEHNILGPVDVAHLSAQIEQVIGDLK